MSIAAFIPILGPAVEKILDLIPDTNARARAEADYQRALLDAAQAESADNREINKVEAAHRSIFVAGWRPFFGWISALCVLYAYLLKPLIACYLLAYHPEKLAFLPDFPMEYVWELIFGMLGISGLRSLEKVKGVSK